MGDIVLTTAGLPISEGGYALLRELENGELYNTETSMSYTVSEIADVVLGYFDAYNFDNFSQLPDTEGIPAGSPVVLENTSFHLTWAEALTTWENLDTNGLITYSFTMDNLQVGTVFGIENKATGEKAETTMIDGDSIKNIFDKIVATNANFLSSFNISFMDESGDGNDDTMLLKRNTSVHADIDLIAYPRYKGEGRPALLLTVDSSTNINTWESIGNGNFYEVEWFIEKESNEYEDFYYESRGLISTHNKLALILPYPGNYNVIMKLYDSFNNVVLNHNKESITVHPYEAEIAGVYKTLGDEVTWENAKYSWEDFTSTWELPFLPKDMPREELKYLYGSLSRSGFPASDNLDMAMSLRYIDDSDDGFSTLPGPYRWDNLEDATWEDTKHIWWDATLLGINTPASFRINTVSNGGTLSIVQQLPIPDIGTIEFTSNILSDAVNLLNASTAPVFSKYEYKLIIDTDTGVEYFILAIAKELGESGDWYHIEPNNIELSHLNLHKDLGYTQNNSIIFEEHQELPKLTHVVFSADHSRIPGKTKAKWTLNYNDNISEDIYSNSKYFSYLFKKAGNYTLSLELEDSNGNVYNKNKNIITIK